MNIHHRYRKIYTECADILKKIIDKRTTLKNEIYKTKKPSSYIPIIEKILQNYELLNKIITETNFMKKDIYYSLILCNEILGDKIKNNFWKQKFELAKEGNELVHVTKQKYIRINTNKGSEEDIKDLDVEATVIPNVYKLNGKVDLSKNKAFKEGKLVVQNIASCIPAYLLNMDEKCSVIDACAAPGNKTSHLSSLMNNKGQITAVEVDEGRFKILNYHIKKFKCENVKALNEDFLKLDPKKFKKIDGILLDPTCSGSGIHDVYEKDEERVKCLQKFQIKMLKHAMAFNPSRIVYSTCSTHKEEGEDVVFECLKDSEYELVDISNSLISKINGVDVKDNMIRFVSDENKETIGFFTALLKRKE